MGSLAKYCRELLYEWAFVVVVLTAIDSLDTLPLGCKTITNVVPKGKKVASYMLGAATFVSCIFCGC